MGDKNSAALNKVMEEPGRHENAKHVATALNNVGEYIKKRRDAMVKVFCDGCGKETNCHPLEIPCHIAENSSGCSGYLDREGNAVSGRMVKFDLCGACSNKAYEAAFQVITSVNVGPMA